MVQIKTGRESPVRVSIGPNCRPPNSSHFRNLKCLKIDNLVSKKREEGREERKEVK